MKHKISLIIPTYNNPHQLRRLLNYYNSFKVNYSTIIVDSSLEQNKLVNKKAASSYPDLSIHYRTYPPNIHLQDKLTDALNYANRPYCVFCASDDFITPNGIQQSASFLEKNQDFNVARGYHINFYIKTNRKGKRQLYWKAPSPVNLFKNSSIHLQDPVSRLTLHLSNYLIATFYAVHRTDFLKMIFKETQKFTLKDDYQFTELLPSILTLIYGKMECLDIFYGARETNPAFTGKTVQTMHDFIKEGSYQKRYSKFKDCLSKHLAIKTHLDKKKSEKIIDDAMYLYMTKYWPFDFKRHLASKIQDILKILHAPDSVYKKIRLLSVFLHNKYTSWTQKSNYSDSLYDLLPEDYDDLNKIRNCIISDIIK